MKKLSLTFMAYSLGCRTNQAEVEEISKQLMAYGFQSLDTSTLPPRLDSTSSRGRSPALLLLNTCVVTQKAEKETRQKIRGLRKKYPESFLVVLGCAVTAKEKFNISLPEADLLILNEDKDKAVNIIANIVETRHAPSLRKQIEQPVYSNNKYIQSGRKFIKIQDGCNNFCSYCLTCHLRGKPTSAPPKKVIEEISYWGKRGIKEIILTGINIGLWGKDAKKQEAVNSLLEKILSETKIERISFSSIYPEMLTDEFLEVVVNNPRISQYFHLSLQSGSQTVLQRMSRKTNLNELLKKLQRIKSKNPNFTFRADIITGFPGETEKEFQETLDFMVNAGISFAHVFTYSPRKGTIAYEMIKSKKWNDLPESIKKERAEKIRMVAEKIHKEEAKKMIGEVSNCLVVKSRLSFRANEESRGIPSKKERRDPSTSPAKPDSVGMTKDQNGMTMYEGITENGWSTRIFNNQFPIFNLKGKIMPVKITSFEENYLLGEVKDS